MKKEVVSARLTKKIDRVQSDLNRISQGSFEEKMDKVRKNIQKSAVTSSSIDSSVPLSRIVVLTSAALIFTTFGTIAVMSPSITGFSPYNYASTFPPIAKNILLIALLVAISGVVIFGVEYSFKHKYDKYKHPDSIEK
jgi:hypothetical protein